MATGILVPFDLHRPNDDFSCSQLEAKLDAEAVMFDSGLRHQRNAPSLLHQRNLLCHGRDTPVFRPLPQTLASTGQRARQEPHAPSGRFLDVRVAHEFLSAAPPQIPLIPPALLVLRRRGQVNGIPSRSICGWICRLRRRRVVMPGIHRRFSRPANRISQILSQLF